MVMGFSLVMELKLKSSPLQGIRVTGIAFVVRPDLVLAGGESLGGYGGRGCFFSGVYL